MKSLILALILVFSSTTLTKAKEPFEKSGHPVGKGTVRLFDNGRTIA